MVCQAMNSWTFCDLVAAFLDLSIAYLLLCASSLAFLVSKFLGLFGLCLPCPCDGLFWNPRNNQCLQRQLVDCPYEKISLVQFSAKSKFPFDSVWADDQIGNSDLKFGDEENHENGHVGLECGASSSSFTERRLQDLVERDSGNKPGVEFGAVNFAASKEEQDDLKGKRVVGRRLRHGLRRRRRGGFISNGNLSSVSSYDTLESDARYNPHSPASISKMANEGTEDPNNYGDDKKAPADFGFSDRVSLGLELNNSNDENKQDQREAIPVEELGGDVQRDFNFDGNEKNVIRVLEQALEEEHAARSALYLELEKERSAAATAADEAMAMILRLQEEKASIEMEARQYQRMIEAKAAYDAEEMNIFKEILLRREREKHFLEKEVEAYRQMILGNDQSDSDVQDVAAIQELESSTLYSKEDPMLMLKQINESIEKPELEIVNSSSDYEVSSFKSQNCTIAFGKELAIPQFAEDDDSLKEVYMHGHPSIDTHTRFLNSNETKSEFQEKGSTIDETLFSQQKEVERWEACSKWNELITPQGLDFDEKSINQVVECQDQTGSTGACIEFSSKVPNVSYPETKDPPNLVLDADSCVYDVHVIDDETKVLKEMSIERSEHQSVSASLEVPRKCSMSLSTLETRYDMNKNSSDISSGLPPRGYSRGKPVPTNLRRNSMSAVDYEKLKIENEVEWLRERLRIVQEGREKLNFSVEHREREKLQLQLLEDIAGQLREIRQLNEPGKAERQASLPPAYSKVTSKKRCWRSSSLGIYRSS